MTDSTPAKYEPLIHQDVFLDETGKAEQFLNKHETSIITSLLLNDKNYARSIIDYEKRNIMIACAFFISMLIVFYQVAHPKPALVYASASDAKHSVMSLTTIPVPINTIPVISEWVTDATVSALSLNFYDYKDKLKGMRENFTSGGWEGYNEALQDGYLDSIVSNKYLVDAIPNGTLVMVHNATAIEPYWEFQIPMLVTFHIGNVSRNSDRLIDIKVVPVKTTENPHGHAIESITLGGGL